MNLGEIHGVLDELDCSHEDIDAYGHGYKQLFRLISWCAVKLSRDSVQIYIYCSIDFK